MTDEKKNEVEVVQETQPAPLMGGGYLDENALQFAEKQIQLQNRAKALAIQATNDRDWCAQGDFPYMLDSGAMKIAALFGVGISDIEVEKEIGDDEKGRWVMYNAQCIMTFQGRSIIADGSASSRDDFFASRWVDNQKVTLPIEEINLTHVRKKAVTNMKNRGVKSLLGLKFTWEDLGKNGVDLTKIAKVKYNAGAQGGKHSQQNAGSREDMLKKYDAEKEELISMVTTMVGGDRDKAIEELKTTYGIATFRGLKRKEFLPIYNQIKQEFDAAFGDDDPLGKGAEV